MDRLIGVFLVALSVGCFGKNAIFTSIGYDAGAKFCTFLFIRFGYVEVVTHFLEVTLNLID